MTGSFYLWLLIRTTLQQVDFLLERGVRWLKIGWQIFKGGEGRSKGIIISLAMFSAHRSWLCPISGFVRARLVAG